MPHALITGACRRAPIVAIWAMLSVAPVLAQTADNGQLAAQDWQRPDGPIAEAVLAPRHLNVSMSNASPDNRYFLRQESEGMPSMASFAREHLWFGGLQIDPVANRARNFTTRGAAGLSVIEAETGRTIEVQVPNGLTVTGARWSPDGSKIAYFGNSETATHIYVADIPSGRSRQVTRTPVLATLNTQFDWTSDGGSVVTVLIPESRGAMPQAPAVPDGPQVRLTMEGENRTRTYASLMEWPHEFEQLEYFATGQLAIVDVASRNVRRVGQPAMIRSVDIGPRGEFMRVTTMQKPFSYIVPVNSFGTKEELWAADGRVVTLLNERPLNEGIRDDDDDDDDDDVPVEMRSISWRPDGAGISYLQQEPAPARGDSAQAPARGDSAQAAGSQASSSSARRKDRVMLWTAPYTDATKQVVYESNTRMGSVRYSPDGQTLFITEGTGGNTHQYAVFLNNPTEKHTIYRHDSDDFYENPGSLVTKRGEFGGDVVRISSDGGAVFLEGTQYFENPDEQAPREFIDRVDIRTGDKTRVFEGDNTTYYDRVVTVLDDDASRLIISRESPTQVPDSYLREANGEMRKLTNNRDYTPQVTNAQRRKYTVTRADGFKFKVDITLPQDYRQGTRLPAMFWFYPREYTDQEGYDRTLRNYNRNRFPNVGVRSMDFLTMEGYAVVVPDAPIIGESGRMNDNYEHDLRNNLAATIDHLDREGYIDRNRLGVGGHSYGAFSTVNAMVHTPFFKAGIAGDGNYNRTLTPLGFQSERRDLYTGRETYLAMSPYLYANNLTGALLMYHGMDDQNVGTHLTHSIRLFHVLNGLGKTASLYMYPYEDHGPATQETVLDLWARWTEWLDRYVKNAGANEPRITTEQQ